MNCFIKSKPSSEWPKFLNIQEESTFSMVIGANPEKNISQHDYLKE